MTHVADPDWKNGDDIDDTPDYLDQQPDEPFDPPWDDEEDDDYDAALDQYDKEIEKPWLE